MHFVLILGVILAMTLAEKAPAEGVAQPAWRMSLAVGAMLLAPLMAALLSAVTIRGLKRQPDRYPLWLARFSRGQHVHAALWVALVGVISYGLAWPQLVRVHLGFEGWILVDHLLILAPVYLPLLLSWGVFYDVDRALHPFTAELEQAEEGADRDAPPGRWRYVALHARHYLALVMAPLVLVLTLADVARWLAPEFSAGPYGWLTLTPLVVLLVLFLPSILAALWRTDPLPAWALRAQIESILADANLRVREILIWRTDGRMANAAVSGVWSRLRYLFLTDRLLEMLDPSEVAAVVRHEAGHVARHHLLLRMLLLGLPLALWGAARSVLPEGIENATILLADYGISPFAQECLLLPGAIVLYGLVALGGYCKLLEHEADLYACDLYVADLASGMDAPQGEHTAAFISALDKITRASGGDPHREGWLHPSVVRRVRFVHRATRDPALAARFQRRLALCAYAMALLYLLSLGAVVLHV
jgi:STE24 endopeptidase